MAISTEQELSTKQAGDLTNNVPEHSTTLGNYMGVNLRGCSTARDTKLSSANEVTDTSACCIKTVSCDVPMVWLTWSVLKMNQHGNNKSYEAKANNSNTNLNYSRSRSSIKEVTGVSYDDCNIDPSNNTKSLVKSVLGDSNTFICAKIFPDDKANDIPSLDEGKLGVSYMFSGGDSKTSPVAHATNASEVDMELISNLNHSATNTNSTILKSTSAEHISALPNKDIGDESDIVDLIPSNNLDSVNATINFEAGKSLAIECQLCSEPGHSARQCKVFLDLCIQARNVISAINCLLLKY
jgi:hypothetical protein